MKLCVSDIEALYNLNFGLILARNPMKLTSKIFNPLTGTLMSENFASRKFREFREYMFAKNIFWLNREN